jgi:protein TonB
MFEVTSTCREQNCKQRRDSSSAQPGKDVATQQATIGVHAYPDYRKYSEPPYPAFAALRVKEGLVLLRVVVSAAGRSKRVKLKQSSGFPLLDQAALEAVKDWEFDPARIGAVPVESVIEGLVRFPLSR